jgi:hypothetical protein
MSSIKRHVVVEYALVTCNWRGGRKKGRKLNQEIIILLHYFFERGEKCMKSWQKLITTTQKKVDFSLSVVVIV